MPRRKAGQPRSGKTRTRSGCQTCRRRRIRCDERLPNCANCVKSRLTCERHLNLKWQTEYEDLGLLFGRQGVWSKYGVAASAWTNSRQAISCLALPPVQACHFVNTMCTSDSGEEDIDDDLGKEASLSSLSPAYSLTTRSPSTGFGDLKLPAVSVLYAPSAWPHLETTWKPDLLQYYAKQVCPLTIVGCDTTSPLAGLLLPFASSSPDITDAILALATLHRGRRESSWKRRALQLEGQLLNRLRKRLREAKAGWIIIDEELPVLMLLLCLFAIIDKCDKGWTTHLRGARELFSLRRRTLNKAVPTSEVSAFADTFFAYQDAIGRTACGEQPVFDSTYWDGNDTKVNQFLGCSPALVSIIGRTTELSRERPTLPVDEFEAQAAQLEERLCLMGPVSDTHLDMATREAAVLKHAAAQIVLHAALNNAKPCTAIIQRLVCHILETMTLSSAVRRAGYLWPLFVAAAELDPECDELWIGETAQAPVSGRRLVLEQLEVIAEQSLANTARAREVIVKVWQGRDEAMADGSDGTCSPCNDWERFVAPLSSNISLA